jgi:DNA-binding transcriptional regulator YiaG
MTKRYRYTASGLDNVVLVGLSDCVDAEGDACVTIPNINGLHRAIATGIVAHRSGISGREMRFLRTEMGMTQAELARVVNREPLAIGRWERGENPIDPNAEALIRLLASDRLHLELAAGVDEVSGRCVPTADPQPIVIDASDPNSYRPLAA